jgi:hypothetical protein
MRELTKYDGIKEHDRMCPQFKEGSPRDDCVDCYQIELVRENEHQGILIALGFAWEELDRHVDMRQLRDAAVTALVAGTRSGFVFVFHAVTRHSVS